MKLLLVFSFGQSLKNLIQKGMWKREAIALEALHAHGLSEVWFLTYNRDDVEVLKQQQAEGLLPDWFHVLPYPTWLKGKLGKLIYSFIGPFLHRKKIKELDAVKSNQSNGSWVASKAARMAGKPFLYRTGYTVTRNLAKQNAPVWKQRLFKWIEAKGYERCAAATVTSYGDKAYVTDRYGVDPAKVHVITNYVDTGFFTPNPSIKKHPKRILFIGRLAPAKNLESLITAISKSDWGLDLVGSGESEEALKAQAQQEGGDIRFLGRMDQKELPALLNAYQYFALTSHYEGMPKSLLEAMSAGLCCLGTEVSGIQEVIQHEQNGLLASGTDAESLLQLIRSVSDYDATELGKHAREYVCKHHSLAGLAGREFELLKAIVGRG